MRRHRCPEPAIDVALGRLSALLDAERWDDAVAGAGRLLPCLGRFTAAQADQLGVIVHLAVVMAADAARRRARTGTPNDPD